MGGFGEDGYSARTPTELVQAYLDTVNAAYGDRLEPYEASFNRRLFRAFATAVHENQEQDLEDLYDSLFVETATGEELTRLCRQLGVRRRPAIQATGWVEWSRNTTTGSLTVPAGTRVTTEPPDPIVYETTDAATFQAGDATATAPIEAVEGGNRGNVGADRVTRMPSPPAGVVGVTNPQPVGDPDFALPSGTQQSLGLDREDDESLRERALESTSIGGAATVRAVRQRIRGLDGAPSLTIYTNRTLSDNANGNGLPALSTELVIYARGSTTGEIAQAIHETVSIGDRLVSGINGSSVTETISETVLAQDRVIEWSSPSEVNTAITVDIVQDAGYAGDQAVKTTLAEYIGGTDPTGGAIAGLDVGEDIILDEFEARLTALDGVVGVADVVIDATGDGTDDTTTRSDGLVALEVGGDEVALVDATSDITVT